MAELGAALGLGLLALGAIFALPWIAKSVVKGEANAGKRSVFICGAALFGPVTWGSMFMGMPGWVIGAAFFTGILMMLSAGTSKSY